MLRPALLLSLPLIVALAGCSIDDPAPPVPAADSETQVRSAFETYNTAITDEDWPAACGQLAPESIDKLKANLARIDGGAPSGNCPATLGRLAAVTEKTGERDAIGQVVRTARVKEVKVTGDAAIIDWAGKVRGKEVPVSQSARRVGGAWKLVDVSE